MKSKYLVFFAILFLSKNSFCQYNNIRFKYLDNSLGLSSNTSNALLRDSKGFMWFGTTLGLNRFDGYEIKVYQYDPNDTNSLSSNFINCLVEDNNSNIWVGTENGLNKFDPKTERFSRFFHATNKNSIHSNYIYDLLVDNENNIWIATAGGLNIYQEKTGEFTSFAMHNFEDDSLPDLILKLAIDKNHNIYALNKNGCFFQYSKTATKFKLIKKFDNNLTFLKQEQLFVTSDNIVWIGYGQNVYMYNPVTNLTKQLRNNNQVFTGAVDAICEDLYGNVWIGTTDKGLFIFNKTGNKLLHTFQTGHLNNNRLKGRGISRLYCDRDSIVWIATIDGGIYYYHKKMYKIESFRQHEDDATHFSDNRINCITQISNGEIYVGTENGIIGFNRDNGEFYTISGKIKNPVLSIFEDSQNNIWITTYKGEVYKGKNNLFSLENIKLNTGRPVASIQTIFEDKSGIIWFGAMGGDGVILKKGDKYFDFKEYTGYTLSNQFVNYIKGDHEENIWITTAHGINRYSRDKSFKIYDFAGKTKLNLVNAVFQDSKKRLWFAFSNGLLLYNNEKDSFILVNENQGLTNEQVLGITEDYQGRLWLLIPDGMLCANVPDKDIKNMKIESYSETDGLPGNQFKTNAILKLTSGEIIAGNIGGLALINPQSTEVFDVASKTLLTDLRIYNKVVKTGEEINGRVLLKNSITGSDKIALNYMENFFSIEFSALSLINPQKCIYKYKLQGFDESWITTGPERRIATFTNINPGKYIFIVKASNEGKHWGPGNKLEIVIHPPFWKSNVAKAVYIILTVLFLILLRHIIRLNERRRIQIRHEKAEAQRLHNLDMMKINFFTNISHEFRTPLTLIISPLEKLLTENRHIDLEKPFKTIQRNSQRLLHLVNQLLDFRKLEAYGLDFYPSTGDIILFTRNIVLSFNDIAESKALKYVFNSNIKELHMQFDHAKYDKIIYNLLSNAFKFTPEKGTIQVELNFTEELKLKNESTISAATSGELTIKVKDTGIGIPAKLQECIFETFVQGNSFQNSALFENGSGIGLSLVNEYVKLHKGTIQVKSEEGNGSCFTVILPVICYHDKSFGLGPDMTEQKLTEVVTDFRNSTQNDGVNKMLPSLLIVEDNEELRFYLKDNLRNNFNIYEADNGQTGFQTAVEIVPDIVVSDVLMPIMDGIELCKKLKNDKNTSHIPVILLTAMNTDNYKLEGIEAEADDYIVKPFNFKILEASINKLLNNQKKIQKKFSGKISVEPREIAVTSLDEQFIKKAFGLVEKNMDNPEFSVNEFSREMAMSRMLLYKKLIGLTGKSPLDFIRTMRLKRAVQLLEKSQLNISEIATRVGFNDPKYFSQCFKKEFNMLPSEYQTKGER